MVKALLNFIFCPFCLHCQEKIDKASDYFCKQCVSDFILIEEYERCRRCFSSLGECKLCKEKGYPFNHFTACFEYHGPPSTLIQHLKYYSKPYLAKEIAAFMVLQYTRMNWKMPDLIIPVPQSITRSFTRGYSQTFLIAKEMSKLMNCKTLIAIKRLSGDLPQVSLNQSQRESLSLNSFCWKKVRDLTGKVVLLIDDVRTTGATLNHCGKLLREAFPQTLYGMSFCT